ncbi:MAG: glycosyltransferase [Chromatiales bacterium]|nr:glycosyltransferase [Chromatiales bacterium]
MKILHVAASLDPASGGPQQVCVRLAAAQASLGHEVRVIAYAPDEADESIQRECAAVPGLQHVALERVDGAGRMERLLARKARARLAPHILDSDCVYIHEIWDPILRVTAKLAAQAGVPYAVAPHGQLDPWSLRQKRTKKRLALALSYRSMLEHAAFLHALNADEVRGFAPLSLSSPVRVIPNGIFLEEIEPLPARGRFRAQHSELGDDPFVLFLSRLHYKKGLDLLAPAFARALAVHPRLRLVVAGPDGGARAAFERQIVDLGIDGRVHLVGAIYGAEKFEVLVDAACFCLPSRQEGFSVAITEALACGVPVVVSEACHFPEVAETGAGRVVPLDIDAVAAALIEIAGDGGLANAMGRAGAALVRERYQWPTIARATLDAIAEACAGRPAQGGSRHA